MADEQSTEVVRELRRIRVTLLGIVFVLSAIFAAVALNGWLESTRPPAEHSQEIRALQSELQAIRNELSNQRNSLPVVIPGGKSPAGDGKQGK